MLRLIAISTVKELLRNSILEALAKLAAAGTLPPGDVPAFVVERTRSREHGDFASNVAMLLAKIAKARPRDLAQAIVGALPANEAIAKVEIAGPGFINFFLATDALAREIRRIHELGDAYGCSSVGGKWATIGLISSSCSS